MERSKITRALSRDGGARIIFASTTSVVQKAHEIHNTSKTMTAALGRCLTGCALMGSLLKDKDNALTLQFMGDGPAGTICCVSDYKGNVRGYAQHPEVELPPNAKGKLDVGGAIGQGMLTVSKDLGLAEPYTGLSDLVSGEVAEDITNYYAVSEQTPTVCALGVRCDTDCSCVAAGGYLLQLLPGAEDRMIDILEKNVAKIPSVSAAVSLPNAAENVIATLFDGIEYDLFDDWDIDYVCNCSRERYERALVTLGRDELARLRDEARADGRDIETVCSFCGKTYSFTADELDAILNGTGETEP